MIIPTPAQISNALITSHHTPEMIEALTHHEAISANDGAERNAMLILASQFLDLSRDERSFAEQRAAAATAILGALRGDATAASELQSTYRANVA